MPFIWFFYISANREEGPKAFRPRDRQGTNELLHYRSLPVVLISTKIGKTSIY